MRQYSIPVRYARAVLHNAVARDLDPVALLRRNRISPRLLLEDEARISIERFADLQVSTMLAMQDEYLGYAERRMPLGSWSMMCHAVVGSATLGQALGRYCRFYQLFDFGLHPLLQDEGESALVRLAAATPGLPPAEYFTELVLFNLHRFMSWLVQEHLPLQAVSLDHPPIISETEYRQVFLGNPVRFEQDAAGLVLAGALLDKPVVQNEASLRHFLRHPVLLMLTQDYARHSWSTRVRATLRQRLGVLPELNEVAGLLEIHPQTLRRRLAAEGTSFMEIKSALRRDTALHFLGKQGLSIEEIAQRAGFSESSAFIRAFKGWTGVTPYTYRKGL